MASGVFTKVHLLKSQ